MARPGGKEVGRVSIRVLPNATRFRNDLKLLLKRVENTMSANLAVTADTRSADAAIRRFQKDWNGRKVTLGSAVTTKGARASLALLSRPRFATIVARVSKSSLKKAATALAALSGGRLVGDLLKNVGERLGNLDRALPKMAAVSLSIASLGSVALSSLGGILTVGAGLASTVGVLGALPGILAGAAVGGAVLAIALSDIKNRLGDLGPSLVDLKSRITDNFWAIAEQPIRDFVSSVLPSLQVRLSATASAIGRWTGSVVSSFQSALGGGVLDLMFANLTKSIDIASTGTGGFAQAITQLGLVGGSYLPRLAQWTADLSNRFGEFITQTALDGRFTNFIETGITSVKQLGEVLANTGSILSGLFRAAEASGGGGLASLADVLGRVADVVNSSAFQTTLATIFAGASAGAAGLATVLGPVGDMFAALAPTLSQILSSSGDALGLFLGQVASALSQPAFARGLTDFFAGIQIGLAAIAPSLPAIASAFGSVASFAGVLAAVLGPVLGSTLSGLAPILTTLEGALKPVVAELGGALTEAIVGVVPAILGLLEALAPLLPTLTEMAVGVLPQVVLGITLLSSYVQLMIPIWTPLIDILGVVLSLFSGPAGITNALLAGSDAVTIASGALNGQFGPAMQGLTQLMVDLTRGFRSFFLMIW